MTELTEENGSPHDQLLEALGCFEHTEALEKIRRLLDLNLRFIDAPRIVSEECDFEAMTWTFSINAGCRVGAGEFAAVRLQPNA